MLEMHNELQSPCRRRTHRYTSRRLYDLDARVDHLELQAAAETRKELESIKTRLAASFALFVEILDEMKDAGGDVDVGWGGSEVGIELNVLEELGKTIRPLVVS